MARLLYHVPGVRVCFAWPGLVIPSVRLVPGLCLPSGQLGPAHASIFGHTQFSQFPQTAPSPQSRLDTDSDNTTQIILLTQLANKFVNI